MANEGDFSTRFDPDGMIVQGRVSFRIYFLYLGILFVSKGWLYILTRVCLFPCHITRLKHADAPVGRPRYSSRFGWFLRVVRQDMGGRRAGVQRSGDLR